jgi:hypothetical protein
VSEVAGDWEMTVLSSQDDEPDLGSASVFPDRTMEMLVIPITSPRGVTLGSALTRKPDLVEAIRLVPGIGAVRLSPLGGTVGPGGENWLGLTFLARLPNPCPRPLDQLMSGVTEFLRARFGPRGSGLKQGRIEGAWCPGFSDLSVEGRKLVGLGFKLTRDTAVVRAIIGVRMPGQDELRALDACHLVFGPGLDPSRLGWLADVMGPPELDQVGAVRLILDPQIPRPEKICA